MESFPRGLTVISGGTRTTLKSDRPWQGSMFVRSAECPFETREQTVVAEGPHGWRVIENSSSPLKYHRLIIPSSCWEDDRLLTLGGPDQIRDALSIAGKLSMERKRPLFLGVHVGHFAGQNYRHLHYHLVELPGRHRSQSTERRLRSLGRRHAGRILSEDKEFIAFLGGCRAGECLLCPKKENASLTRTRSIIKIAELIHRIVAAFGERFVGTEGFPPHFMLGLKIQTGTFKYGFYLPILNHWGFTEYFGLLEGTPLLLPWPHEVTAQHLLNNQAGIGSPRD
jgi:diadenosine tetraphosphate (Ap4A) HIT family hydrolase